jgi:hypothetical protein
MSTCPNFDAKCNGLWLFVSCEPRFTFAMHTIRALATSAAVICATKKLDNFQVFVSRSQMDWGHVIAIHGICICTVIEKKSSSV